MAFMTGLPFRYGKATRERAIRFPRISRPSDREWGVDTGVEAKT